MKQLTEQFRPSKLSDIRGQPEASRAHQCRDNGLSLPGRNEGC